MILHSVGGAGRHDNWENFGARLYSALGLYVRENVHVVIKKLITFAAARDQIMRVSALIEQNLGRILSLDAWFDHWVYSVIHVLRPQVHLIDIDSRQ